MTDIFTTQKRSEIMSKIRSKNTSIDLKMEKMISEIGCPYLMYPKEFGRPDFVIVDVKIAIFCDGDFWHGYRYQETSRGLNNFWKNKIERNMKRDAHVNTVLRREGWAVLRFWQHDIEKRSNFCKEKIKRKILARAIFAPKKEEGLLKV